MAKAICKFCSTEFEFSPAHKRVYCGRQCYENFLKNNGTRKGVKLSEETKLKMSIAKQNMSKETKGKLSIAAKKHWEYKKMQNGI